MQRSSVQAALEVDVRLFTHQYQVNQIVTLSTDRYMQGAHLIVETQNVWVYIGVEEQIGCNLRAFVLNCEMQEGLVAQGLC